MTSSEPIDPNQLRPGPIQHESLPPDLLEQIGAVYEIVGPYLDTTLEQFEILFMRDAAPEDEVTLWMSIVSAWAAYHEKHLDEKLLPAAAEKKLLAALISISTGVEDTKSLGVPVEIGQQLLECYEGLGE